jgi:uncharacterized protein DUF6290
MGVTSIRLNDKEEKLIKYLKKYYECDTSTLLKKSLLEMYEDIEDKIIIEEFEKKEDKRKSKFSTYEDIIS